MLLARRRKLPGPLTPEAVVDKDWQKYLDLASGVKEATQKRAEAVVRRLVKQGEIAAERAEKAVDDLLARSEANRKAITSIVKSETEKTADRLGLVRQRDLKDLERKIERLERQVSSASGGASKKQSKRSAKKSGKKATAKKSAAAKRAARKTAAKKTAARGRSAKKTAPPSGPESS